MSQKVPKILHAIWLDSQPLPDRLRGYRKSWETHLSDYTLHEWTRYNLPMKNQFVARQMGRGNFCFACDYLRWERVYEMGGVYFDCDVKVLKPLDPVLACGGFLGFEVSKTESARMQSELQSSDFLRAIGCLQRFWTSFIGILILRRLQPTYSPKLCWRRGCKTLILKPRILILSQLGRSSFSIAISFIRTPYADICEEKTSPDDPSPFTMSVACFSLEKLTAFLGSAA